MTARDEMNSERKSTITKPMRVALLLAWRSKGFTRPRYGLVDDEELLRTGRSTFLSTDGQQLSTTLQELLLLQPASSDAVVHAAPAIASQ